MWQEFINASSVDQVIKILAENREDARVIAGATDLILEIERGIRNGIQKVIDISRIRNQNLIFLDGNDVIHLGPMVTHEECGNSRLIYDRAYPLWQAALQVGAPQIRNRGTVAGNLITASPANDTITPLMALGAEVTLRSIYNERKIPLSSFYTGVKSTIMHPDEMLIDIMFPAMREKQRGRFIKFGLRKAQAISLVNVAFVLTFDEEIICQAAIKLGAVAPTIISASRSEEYLIGRTLNPKTIEIASLFAMEESRPIDDVRSSADYRREIVKVLTKRGLCSMKAERNDDDDQVPVINASIGDKSNYTNQFSSSVHTTGNTKIVTKINGKEYVFRTGFNKTLLQLIRGEAKLIGTKDGCAEGECGACTVLLDGKSVMSCLIPAARADGAEIITVEGLSRGNEMHPLQVSFIREGAVQCGYCTPGFLVSAAALLKDNHNPSSEEIKIAITGNLCRCTGYYKIIQAIENSS